MSMPWFKVDANFFRHPKVLRLQKLLEEPLASLYVLHIWAHCADFAPMGQIEGGSDAIEAAAGWHGKPGALTAALLKVRLLDLISDETDDGSPLIEVHDWWDHQRGHYEKAKVDVERRRVLRSNDRALTARSGSGHGAATALLLGGNRAVTAGRLDERREEKIFAGDPTIDHPDDVPPKPEPVAEVASNPSPSGLVLTAAPTVTKKPKTLSRQQTAYAWAMEQRAKQTDKTDKPPSPAAQNKIVDPILAELGGPGFRAAWRNYLTDPYAGDQPVPWPFLLFASQWRRHQAKGGGGTAKGPETVKPGTKLYG